MKSLVVSTAMAGALLSGCATNTAPRADISANAAVEAMAEGRQDRAITHAEAAVLAAPRDASYRAMLGNAYLENGRFAAAQTSFDDAMMLGDTSPRTALSLALTLTAQAKYTESAALLSDWEGSIATADLGLALALSGQPERGIHLMTNAIRGGENTVKMRQNLAYAYATAGRWRDARLMAAQDVPADQVGQRMAQWAEMASPLAYQHRVANLLGVPVGVTDDGQPMQLALANHPAIDQLAAEATALAGADQAPVAELAAARPVAQPAPAMASAETISIPASGSELPAVGRPVAAPALATPLQALAPQAENPTQFLQAFTSNEAVSASPAPVAQPAPALASAAAVSNRYASTVEPRVSGSAPRTAQQFAAETAAAPAPRSSAPRAFRTPVSASADSSHLVQLGSFSSEQGAQRAWGIYVSRYPELANHEMVITEAVVRGKRYFRVSAGGFNDTQSRSMCGRVDSSGGDGCISWASSSPLPGAVSSNIMLARR